MFNLRENIAKIIKYIFILISIFIPQSKAHSDNYKLVLSFGFIKQTVYQINTTYKENNNNYEINFKLLSTNGISSFLSEEIEGIGFSSGRIINDKHIPIKYQYIERKDNSQKEYYVDFNNNNIAIGNRIPSYDKTKLTPINDDMLVNVIDPALAFIKLSNFSNLNNCDENILIYDAKRRFDLTISNLEKNGNRIQCLIKSKKIGGYKRKEGLNPLELPYEMIIEFENMNSNYKLLSISGENKYFKLSIIPL